MLFVYKMAVARKLEVEGALSLLENDDFDSDFDSDSDQDDSIPLARFARRPASDNELEKEDFEIDLNKLYCAAEVTEDNNFLDGFGDNNSKRNGLTIIIIRIVQIYAV